MKKIIIILIVSVIATIDIIADVYIKPSSDDVLIFSNITFQVNDGSGITNITGNLTNTFTKDVNCTTLNSYNLTISNHLYGSYLDYQNFEQFTEMGCPQLMYDIGRSNSWVDLGQMFSQTRITGMESLGNGLVLVGTGSGGKILRSTDYGLTWQDLSQQAGESQIYSIKYLGNGICIAGTYANGKIIRSTDYGQTWTDLGQQYTQALIACSCYLGGGVCVAGTWRSGVGASLIRSTNYGLTWSYLGLYDSDTTFSICPVERGIVLAGSGSGGKILRSTDYGATWADLGRLESITQVRGLCYLGGGVCLAAGNDSGRVMRSTDYGATWSSVTQLGASINVFDLCYVGNGVVFAGTNPNSYMYKSTDYGLTWNFVKSFGLSQVERFCYLGDGILLLGTGNTSAKIYRSCLSDPTFSSPKFNNLYLQPADTNLPIARAGGLYVHTNGTFYKCTNTTWVSY